MYICSVCVHMLKNVYIHVCTCKWNCSNRGFGTERDIRIVFKVSCLLRCCIFSSGSQFTPFTVQLNKTADANVHYCIQDGVLTVHIHIHVVQPLGCVPGES